MQRAMMLTLATCLVFVFLPITADLHLLHAFAQDAVTPVDQPSFFQAILDFLTGKATTTTGILLVAEILMRLIPTSRAMSLLVPINMALGALKAVIDLIQKLIDVMINIAQNKTS